MISKSEVINTQYVMFGLHTDDDDDYQITKSALKTFTQGDQSLDLTLKNKTQFKKKSW